MNHLAGEPECIVGGICLAIRLFTLFANMNLTNVASQIISHHTSPVPPSGCPSVKTNFSVMKFSTLFSHICVFPCVCMSETQRLRK